MKIAPVLAAMLLFCLVSFAQESNTEVKNPSVKADPLSAEATYIVDGKKIVNGNKDKGKFSITDIVNPMEIESINVIKPDQALKLYGEEGRNGVVLITTRKPNQPLYIIDGLQGPSSKLSTLNPAEIEKIEVLKNESSIQLYGDPGKYGAIIITTRKLNKSKSER